MKRQRKILDFPELRQVYGYDCGACALTCALAYYGIDLREEYVMKLAGTTKDGTNPVGILRVPRYYGLRTVSGRMSPEKIRWAISHRWPIILALQAYRNSTILYAEDWKDGHWVVGIGYDGPRFLFEDPASYKRTWLAEPELLDRWHDLDSGNRRLLQWGCIIQGNPAFRAGEAVHMD
jgi:ABC-type bacteriocin/lantibiotic exporter with double-glycine peptidase domain